MNKTLIALALLSVFLVGGSVMLAMKSKSVSAEPQIDSTVATLWKQWKLKYGRRFADPEQNQYRLEVFAENLKFVQADHSGTMGITQFADLTREEFAEIYLTENKETQNGEPQAENLPVSTQAYINWVDAGKVTAVKNQGRCGSCWSFSATGAVESALIIGGQAPQSVNLSEQQLVDCDHATGNNGCGGGSKEGGLDYVLQNGITTEANYPYVAVDGACNASKIVAPIYSISKYYQVFASTQSLLEALAITPITISVDASNWSFYTGGVFSNCNDTTHNHAVLLVGIQDGSWIVKNSWGPNWGENGYIRLQNGNTCGLANVPYYPIA